MFQRSFKQRIMIWFWICVHHCACEAGDQGSVSARSLFSPLSPLVSSRWRRVFRPHPTVLLRCRGGRRRCRHHARLLWACGRPGPEPDPSVPAHHLPPHGEQRGLPQRGVSDPAAPRRLPTPASLRPPQLHEPEFTVRRGFHPRGGGGGHKQRRRGGRRVAGWDRDNR